MVKIYNFSDYIRSRSGYPTRKPNRNKTKDNKIKRRIKLSKRKRANKRVIDFDDMYTEQIEQKRKHDVRMKPRNPAQEYYVKALFNDYNRIILAIGPAGTGKTHLAVLRSIKALKDSEVRKIVITRPAVSVEESHGYLPGDLNEKMEPWTRPIIDVFEEFWSPRDIKRMMQERIIEIAPLAYMRGRTFKSCYIIADEMQNATPSQMKMLLTRCGWGSKMIVTGDLNQHDRGYEENGLKDFVERIKNIDCDKIVLCKFDKNNVERDPIVSDILAIYDEA